jgi:L-alanine-DL-glutamate epimerase-like enolase superfamily enzyme
LRIERVEVRITDLPNRLQRQSATGSYDTGASGSLLGKPVLVRIHAGGAVGAGQIRPIAPSHFLHDTGPGMVTAIKDIYAPRMIGKDVFDIEAIEHGFDLLLPGNTQARAAIDHALHDVQGKLLGLPVHKLIGGRCHERIPLEWSVSLADDVGTMIAESTRAREQFGIATLCLKAGDRRGFQKDVENFIAVRKALGEGVVIGIDPNTGWNVAEARRAIDLMAPHRLDYIEQPIERRNLDGLRLIREHARGIPLMADESVMSVQDAHALASAGAVDVFCIKLYKHGGLRGAGKVAAIAEGADIKVNIGGLAAYSQLEAAAGVHFYASLAPRRVMPAGEFVFGLGAIGPDPLVGDSDFRIVDGHVTPPSGPGLGVTLDEKAIERLTLVKEMVG